MICLSLKSHAQRRMQQLDEQRSDENRALQQYEDSIGGDFKSRLRWGGNFGGSFGSGGNVLILQPMVGYQLTKSTIPGIGFTYIYYDVNYSIPVGSSGTYKTVNQSSSIYGPIAYIRQKLAGPLFLQGEYQGLSFQRYVISSNSIQENLQRFWNNSLFLGGGYVQTGGTRGPYLLVMYDVLWSENIYKSFYSSPYNIRIGIML